MPRSWRPVSRHWRRSTTRAGRSRSSSGTTPTGTTPGGAWARRSAACAARDGRACACAAARATRGATYPTTWPSPISLARAPTSWVSTPTSRSHPMCSPGWWPWRKSTGSASSARARSTSIDRTTPRTAPASWRAGAPATARPIDCAYVIGCCWLLARRAFREVGGFDPRFFINHWEVDYCLRLKQRGWRIRYEPRAVARHKIALGGTRSPERLYYLYRNKLLVIRTSGYFHSPALAAFAATAGAAARIAAHAVVTCSPRETAASLKGLWDGLRGRTGALGQARP